MAAGWRMIWGHVGIDTEGSKGVDQKKLMDLRVTVRWEAIGGL